jgi:tryptophan synthase alpha chain
VSAVRAAIEAARAEGRAALVIYLTFGDPDPATSVELVCAAAAAGADVIELGVPFSDPSADGPVIQRAMERALARGAGLSTALEAAAAIRDRCAVPLVLFGYYNPIAVRGVDRFADDAAAAGIDSVLTVDLPADEIAELAGPLAARGLGVVPLVAPTTTAERLEMLAPLSAPFVYAISMTGVTGASLSGTTAHLDDMIAQIRGATDAPVCVGFGVKTAADAARIAAVADGVVVGSAVVSAIEQAPDAPAAIDAVRALVTELRRGVGG